MPKQSTQSGLAKKYGNKLDDAVKSHSGDETSYGMQYGQLPGGIKGGVAQLTKCYFKQYEKGPNKGEYFFFAAGVVIEPAEHNGQNILGLPTSIMEAVCETTTLGNKVTTVEEHIENILNEMRKLGIETDGAGGDDLEGLAESLAEAAPYFRFGTSQSEPTDQYPEPKVWENWNGSKGLEEYEPDTDSGVVDKTETTTKKETENPPFGDEIDMLADAADGGDKVSAGKLEDIASEAGVGTKFVENAASWNDVADEIRAARKRDAKADIEDAKEAPQSDSGDDLVEIGKKADDGDEEALEAITEASEKAGVEDTFEFYVDYAKAIIAKNSGSETEESSEGIVPEKGDVYDYKARKNSKGISVEITTVFKIKKTVNAKDLDDGKTMYKQVSWDKLSV